MDARLIVREYVADCDIGNITELGRGVSWFIGAVVVYGIKLHDARHCNVIIRNYVL